MEKIENLPVAVKKAMQDIVKKTIAMLPKFIDETLKSSVTSYCPSAEEEASQLSFGITGEGSSLGIPQGNRFLRSEDGGSGIPVMDAIKQDVPKSISDGYSFGNVARLNDKTVFSWKRGSGQMLSTKPFNGNYLMALENGGTWEVVPRDDRPAGDQWLNPEGNILTKSMTKTLQPRQMFFKGGTDNSTLADLNNRVKKVINESI